MLAIAARELRSIFLSPLAWVLLCVVQFILAWLFLVQVENFMQIQPRLAGLAGAPGVTDLVAAPLLNAASVFIMLLIPLLSMRLLSEEYRRGTFSLLLSAPLSITSIVLGKYLALLAFLGIVLLLTAAMPLSLLVGTDLDLGKLASGLLGLLLALGGFAAIGLFFSSLTSSPTVAATGSYGLLLFLLVIDLASGAEGTGSTLFFWLSPVNHLQQLFLGLVTSSDLIYFLLLIATFLILAIRRLESHRGMD